MHIPNNEYNYILEHLPIICVDLIIIHNQKCLLLKRNNEPAKDQYWFPGGRINKLETIKDAAIRKAKEETNIDCEFEKILTIEETIFNKNHSMKTEIHTVNICCLMQPKSIFSIQTDEYHNGFKWIENQSELYHESINRVLSKIGFQL